MPLDPSIILQGQNPNAAFQQAQAQQMERYQVAQAKSDFEDQQNLKQAWRQAGGDPTQTLSIAAKLGVSPKMIQAFQQQQIQLQNSYATLHKTQAETGLANANTGKTQGEVMDAKHKAFADLLEPVVNAKPEQYGAVLGQQLQAAVDQGRISKDEMAQYGSMTQDQAKDLQTSFRGALANSEIAKNNATATKDTALGNVAKEKQANEAATQIETANAAKRAGASTNLVTALGPVDPTNLDKPLSASAIVAYGKALQGIDPATAKAAGFPQPDDVAKMTARQALKATNYAGMNSEQRQRADQEQTNAAELARHNRADEQLKAQSNGFQAQTLGLDKLKTQAALFEQGLGADGKPITGAGADLLKTAAQNTSDGRLFVDQDEAFKGLPKGQQIQVRNAAAQNGVPLISGAAAKSVKDVDTARNTINSVFQTYMQTAGAGASGIGMKPLQAAGNWAAARSGLNPQLDAASKNFLSAIEAIKTAGGPGSGLRITAVDINKVGAQMPKFGDTQEQLIEKAKTLNSLITDKIDRALHQVPVTSGGGSVPKGATVAEGPDGHRIFSTDGQQTWFDAQTGKKVQ